MPPHASLETATAKRSFRVRMALPDCTTNDVDFGPLLSDQDKCSRTMYVTPYHGTHTWPRYHSAVGTY
jgi:hypothetical protein